MKKKTKRIIIVSVAATVTALTVAGLVSIKPLKIKNYQKEPLELPIGFTITAHAGALNTKANTPESIKAGLDFVEMGSVEVDVRFDAQKNIVLSHDTVKGSGKHTTLAEALELLKTYPARMNLDLKEITDVAAVQKLADANFITPQLFFTGVSAAQAELVRKEAPRIPFYINESIPKGERTDSAYLETMAQQLKGMGAVGINLNYKEVSEELVVTMHNYNLLVSVWTVDDKEDMCKMLRLGVDNITSKNPDVLKDLMQNWG